MTLASLDKAPLPQYPGGGGFGWSSQGCMGKPAPAMLAPHWGRACLGWHLWQVGWPGRRNAGAHGRAEPASACRTRCCRCPPRAMGACCPAWTTCWRSSPSRPGARRGRCPQRGPARSQVGRRACRHCRRCGCGCWYRQTHSLTVAWEAVPLAGCQALPRDGAVGSRWRLRS